MTELHRALHDIRSIRAQVAETTAFRGYGPLTLSLTAASAVVAAAVQAVLVPQPTAHAAAYVALWMSTAVFSAALIATEMLRRSTRLHHGMADLMIRRAVLQFLPAALAGATLPFVLLRTGQPVLWLLPGLWQVLFGVGVFASCRGLPRPMLLVGAWFLLTGFLCFLFGHGWALHPACMAVPYTIGMAAVALIHARHNREITDEETL